MLIKYSEKLKMTSPSVTWDQVQKKKSLPGCLLGNFII